MKKGMWIVTVVLLVSTWAWAESSVWKVKKGQSVLYLGATCHVLRETDYPLPPEFDRAYKASDIMVFETDIGKLQDPSTQQKLLARSSYADGSTVDQHLSPKAFADLSAYCTSNGIPLEALQKFNPSMIVAMLTILELKKLGISQEGVDMFFYGQASKDKKIVKGLETIDEQIEYVVTMADGNEDDIVTYTLNDMKNLKQQFNIIADAWRKGNDKKLTEFIIDEIKKARMEKLYQRIFTDRNNRWMPLVDAYLNTPQTEFILVGAGHLVGPEGIVAALRKKGYAVDKL